MNNSLSRMIDGMIEALRVEVIPHVGAEFARGQVFGVIYMLKTIKLRAAWSVEFVGEQLSALAGAIEALRGVSGATPLLEMLPDIEVPERLVGSGEMERQRDGGNRAICAAIDWYFENREHLPAETCAGIGAALNAYMARQIDWEFKNNTRPMLAEMSRGAEIDV